MQQKVISHGSRVWKAKDQGASQKDLGPGEGTLPGSQVVPSSRALPW